MKIQAPITMTANIIRDIQTPIKPKQLPEVPQFIPKDSLLHYSHTTQIIKGIQNDFEKGNEFVKKVVEASTWYEPPKGQKVDTWA